MEPLVVFLDTNVLLNAFSAFRKTAPLPEYITDKTTRKYTFEKCVFEVFMAFRGVGGKKPDEGRGDWAQRNLKQENDPKRVGDLSGLFHDQDTELAFYWANQILELRYDDAIEDQKQRIFQVVSEDQQQDTLKNLRQMEELASQRKKFEMLCNEFHYFLRESEIEIIPYLKVFEGRGVGGGVPTPYELNSFAQDTVLPSEDFEIVYAAMIIRTDIFVTDDKRLIRCAPSLGLNYSLSASNFCESKDYATKVQKIREFKGEK